MLKHGGGEYVGESESQAQVQFSLMLAQAALSQIVREERAERIRALGIQQQKMLGWRQVPARKRGNKHMRFLVALFGFALIAFVVVCIL